MIQKPLKKQTHGTTACYNHGGCRCKKCTKANREKVQRTREKNREKYNSYMRKRWANRPDIVSPESS